MAADKVFAKGVMAFKPLPQAPAFVKGTIVITLDDLNNFVNGDGAQYLTDYNGKKQIRLQITENKSDGKYSIAVDTWKKGETTSTATVSNPASEVPAKNAPDDLPFVLLMLCGLGSMMQFML